jgi:hypothetical protein
MMAIGTVGQNWAQIGSLVHTLLQPKEETSTAFLPLECIPAHGLQTRFMEITNAETRIFNGTFTGSSGPSESKMNH